MLRKKALVAANRRLMHRNAVLWARTDAVREPLHQAIGTCDSWLGLGVESPSRAQVFHLMHQLMDIANRLYPADGNAKSSERDDITLAPVDGAPEKYVQGRLTDEPQSSHDQTDWHDEDGSLFRSTARRAGRRIVNPDDMIL